MVLPITLWTNYPNCPGKEKKEWDRFYQALGFHEDEHHELCKRLVRMIHQKLMNEKNEPYFKWFFKAELAKFQVLNDKLDAGYRAWHKSTITAWDNPILPNKIKISSPQSIYQEKTTICRRCDRY